MTRAGIAVLVASGLYIIHRERIVARSRRAERPQQRQSPACRDTP
ncbi:MAG: hypothetical protein ACK5YF_06580 [Rhodobacterales bacterium]|jgi:hypothetical protein